MKKLIVFLFVIFSCYYAHSYQTIENMYAGKVILGSDKGASFKLRCFNPKKEKINLILYNYQDNKIATISFSSAAFSKKYSIEGLGPFMLELDPRAVCSISSSSLRIRTEKFITNFLGSSEFYFYVPENTQSFDISFMNQKDLKARAVEFILSSPKEILLDELLESKNNLKYNSYKTFHIKNPVPGKYKLSIYSKEVPWHYSFWLSGIKNEFFKTRKRINYNEKLKLFNRLAVKSQISAPEFYIKTHSKKEKEYLEALDLKDFSKLQERVEIPILPEDPSEAAEEISKIKSSRISAPMHNIEDLNWIKSFFSSLKKPIYYPSYLYLESRVNACLFQFYRNLVASIEKETISSKLILEISRGYARNKDFYSTKESALWLSNLLISLVSSNSIEAIIYPRLIDSLELDGLLTKKSKEKYIFKAFIELRNFLKKKPIYTVASENSSIKALFSLKTKEFFVSNATSNIVKIDIDCSLSSYSIVGKAEKNEIYPYSIAVFKCLNSL